MSGVFISLEGTEGVGKSTMLAHVESRILAAGHAVTLTREPGGTPLGERIRELVLDSEPGALSAETETLLMFAARAHHVAEVVEPALQRGDWVICDRFTDATRAYQGGGRGMGQEIVTMLEREILHGLKPDLTLLLDAPVEQGLERIAGRELDHFEQEGQFFFERVRASYLTLARAEPQRIRLIDASRDIETVRGALDAVLDAFLAERSTAHG